jgi:holo-[acyl-carrier protein] synthase
MKCDVLGPILDIRLGADIVDKERIARNLKRFGPRFLSRLLTESEIAYCTEATATEPTRIRRVAGRIAAKEAIAKALGAGLNGAGYQGGVSWREIAIVPAQAHQGPGVQLSGRAAWYAAQCGISAWRLSISHDGDVAQATALGLVRLQNPSESDA